MKVEVNKIFGEVLRWDWAGRDVATGVGVAQSQCLTLVAAPEAGPFKTE